MAVKSFKPYSAGRRFMTVASFEEIQGSPPAIFPYPKRLFFHPSCVICDT